MKPPLVALVAVGSALAVGQGVFRYADRTNNVEVLAPGGVAYRVLSAGAFELTLQGGKGQVVAKSRTQGLEMTGGSIVATLVPDPARNGQNRLQRAVASGQTRTIKTDRRQTSQISANSALYVAGATEATLTLKGSVSLRNLDQAKRQSLLATGSSGVARLAAGAVGTGQSGLKGAVLEGPVRVTVVETGAKRSTVVATARRMVYDNNPGNPTVTLTGNVRIEGQGESNIGSFTNLAKAVLKLNSNNELVGFSTQ